VEQPFSKVGSRDFLQKSKIFRNAFRKIISLLWIALVPIQFFKSMYSQLQFLMDKEYAEDIH